MRQYCAFLVEALDSQRDGEVVIDMDAVADAVGKEGEKPAFYVSEQSQQRKFTCGACEECNDILGRFGYRSLCGTRNDLADFEEQTVLTIRERLNAGTAPEDCVRDAVSFDYGTGCETTGQAVLSMRRRSSACGGYHAQAWLTPVILALCAGCAPAPKKTELSAGIDLAGMDKSIAPGENFNAYTNGGGEIHYRSVQGMLFDGQELREVLRRSGDGIEIRNEYGRCHRLVSNGEALELDLDLFIGIGNRRRIRYLRPRTQKSAINAGSRTTQRLKGAGGINIAHPLMREHRQPQGIEQ